MDHYTIYHTPLINQHPLANPFYGRFATAEGAQRAAVIDRGFAPGTWFIMGPISDAASVQP